MVTPQKVIWYLFCVLFFFTPLILWPFTSEVFEFNKMVFVYAMTTLISASWVIRMILERRFIFCRTILDIPFLLFLISQLISTAFSIDPRTSIFGYYSRFNGGLLSTICYLLLYWAFVSNMNNEAAKKTIAYSLLPSAFLVSAYGILEHFGIDKNIWVQDVQNRVFSTLGQPNWLAAWLVALTPLTWSGAIAKIKDQKSKMQLKNKKVWTYLFLSILFFVTLLYTKSRSGILGFLSASLVFWTLTGFNWLKSKAIFSNFLSVFLLFNFSFLILYTAIGNPFKIYKIQLSLPADAPVPESGGTESGVIRQIIWRGALEIWKHYPIFGTGPETFAYAYPKFRPVEHNLVSEWDFIYNKAHNEYLNLLANMGILGELTYLTVILASLIAIFNYRFPITNFRIAILAGYVSLLVTNFFGFSVVPTQLLLFLFPAFAGVATISDQPLAIRKNQEVKDIQKFLLALTLIATTYLLTSIARYWYADILYTQAKNLNRAKKAAQAERLLLKAIRLSPQEPGFHLELAESYSGLKKPQAAISEINRAVTLSPANVNLRRAEFNLYLELSAIDPKYLTHALTVLEQTLPLAPTNAKLFYNLGLTYERTGQREKALTTLQKAVEMKPNYKEARFALALLLLDEKENAAARRELNYILTNIDPNDNFIKKTLEEAN